METILGLICTKTGPEVQNTVLVANDGGATTRERHGAVEVVRLRSVAKVGAVAVLPSLFWELGRARADVIVIHEPNPMALLAYYLVRPAGKLIVWFHSEVIRPSWRYALFYRPFLRFAFNRASRIVVASPALVESAHQLAEWKSKCVVLPYGVDPAINEGESVRARADAIRAQGAPLVLFVGRLVRYKGVDVLLEAMRGLNARAAIVGNGPERESLEATAVALGVGDRVSFVGEASEDELSALYRACDLFVLPSITRQEAFGVVLVEAMARQKPVVSTALGTGSGWVNQDGETGFVVPPRNADALRSAIQRLITDDALRTAMGTAAATRAKTIFGVDRMISSTLALYRLVGDESSTAGMAA